MVAPALRHGPSFEQAHDRDERRVEDRHCENEQRQQERRDGGAGDVPARGKPERSECEAEHLASAVAHEDGCRPAQPQVVGQEAEASEADAECEQRNHVIGVDRERVDGEERT